MVIFDDMLEEKVKVYNSGIEIHTGEEYGEYEFQQRTGDIYIPSIKFEDSLQNSLEFFENCCRTGEESRSGPDQCLRVMKVLEWAQRELAKTSEVK